MREGNFSLNNTSLWFFNFEPSECIAYSKIKLTNAGAGWHWLPSDGFSSFLCFPVLPEVFNGHVLHFPIKKNNNTINIFFQCLPCLYNAEELAGPLPITELKSPWLCRPRETTLRWEQDCLGVGVLQRVHRRMEGRMHLQLRTAARECFLLREGWASHRERYASTF